MRRTNTFIVEDCPALWELADSCARLYNELNFERRQAYIRCRCFEWYPKHSTKIFPAYRLCHGPADNKQEQRSLEEPSGPKKRLKSRNLPALAVERVDEKSKGSCQLERNQNQYQTACMSQVAVGAEIAYQNRVREQR